MVWDAHEAAFALSVTRLDRLFESVALRRGLRLVLDFGDVQYLSSAVLGKLINLKKKVATVRGTLRMRGMHPEVQVVFQICRLDEVFEIEA